MRYSENLYDQIDELAEENAFLRNKLKALEKEYHEFRDGMVNASTNVTNEWVKAIVSGDIVIK